MAMSVSVLNTVEYTPEQVLLVWEVLSQKGLLPPLPFCLARPSGARSAKMA